MGLCPVVDQQAQAHVSLRMVTVSSVNPFTDCRSGLMAITGCLITILSLAYSTFVQQLIGIELLPLYDDYGIGNIPRSETWDQQIGHGTSKPCR